MNEKILIVDDQPDNLDAIVRFIEEDNYSYELLQAINVDVALKIVDDVIPDLIITDWEMPGKDGISFIKELKADDRFKDIPVIMCTGVMLTSADLMVALDAGAVDYIRKPIDKVELLARIQSTLWLANSYRKIKELSEFQNQIFSVIAHDLRTPVGNIKSFVSWGISQIDSYNKDDVLKMLNSIEQQSAASFRTLEALLNWSKCRDERVLNLQKNNIKNIIAEAIEAYQEAIEQKRIEIVMKTLCNVVITCDREMISAVVKGFLSNAIKFSNVDSKIKVECNLTNGRFIFSIKDYGVGISQKHIADLFDTTKYHSTYGTLNEKGVGLGLKICKKFIEQHSGTIKVNSIINKGSRFTFEIPIGDA